MPIEIRLPLILFTRIVAIERLSLSRNTIVSSAARDKQSIPIVLPFCQRDASERTSYTLKLDPDATEPYTVRVQFATAMSTFWCRIARQQLAAIFRSSGSIGFLPALSRLPPLIRYAFFLQQSKMPVVDAELAHR